MDLRILIVGLGEETFLDIYQLQVSCACNTAAVYVRRRALQCFAFLLLTGWRGTVCSIFTTCLKRQHKGMGHKKNEAINSC